jgi:hypothetical protein
MFSLKPVEKFRPIIYNSTVHGYPRDIFSIPSTDDNVVCLAKFPDGHCNTIFPKAEMVIFWGNDKNFNFYSIRPSLFPSAKMFAIIGHPAEFSVQYVLKNYPVIVSNAHYFETHPNKLVVHNDRDFEQTLNYYLFGCDTPK